MEKTTTCSPALRFACTSTACVLADSACLPADFLKVRLQLQNELLPPSAPRLGVVAMARTILQKEGVLAFWSGLPAAATRQFCYGGFSFFAYPFIKDALPGDSVPTAVAAGALSRAAAPRRWPTPPTSSSCGSRPTGVARSRACRGATVAWRVLSEPSSRRKGLLVRPQPERGPRVVRERGGPLRL